MTENKLIPLNGEKKEEKPGPQFETIIVAPHPDDEIIGCFELLNDNSISPIVIYTSDVDNERRAEAAELRNHTNVKIQLFLNTIPSKFLHPTNMFYFPHPIYETHPDHRLQGIGGEQLARAGYDVTFYITEMNAPFKFECSQSERKKILLDTCYHKQSSLWKYEHKYFLFSGYDKWVFKK